MKEQYVGDVNDYRKYALLRALSDNGQVPLGVCWMLTTPDDRSDGNKIQYLTDPAKWQAYDPSLFDALRLITKVENDNKLALVEQSSILPNTRFFNNILEDDLESRDSFFAQAKRRLQDADLVFFDPDNGIEIPSKPKGHRNSSKYVYQDEIIKTFSNGQSVLVYQHFTRENRQHFIKRLVSSLSSAIPDADIQTFRSPHVVFFLLAHPKHSINFEKIALGAGCRWNDAFLVYERNYSARHSVICTY